MSKSTRVAALVRRAAAARRKGYRTAPSWIARLHQLRKTPHIPRC
jgi:hypothetical protein